MYSTDLTDAQWNNIKDYLDKAGRKSKFSVCSIWERADLYSENGGAMEDVTQRGRANASKF